MAATVLIDAALIQRASIGGIPDISCDPTGNPRRPQNVYALNPAHRTKEW